MNDSQHKPAHRLLADGHGYSENGEVIATLPFAYPDDPADGVENLLPPETRLERRAAILAWATVERLLDWVWADGMNNPEGLLDRTKVMVWNVHRIVHSEYTLTSLAGEGDKAKQSLGRQHDSFKRYFPEVIRARKACSK
jgi:hypothetical protein